MSEVSMKAEVIKFSLYIVDNFYCNRKVQFLQVLKESQVRYHKIRKKKFRIGSKYLKKYGFITYQYIYSAHIFLRTLLTRLLLNLGITSPETEQLLKVFELKNAWC